LPRAVQVELREQLAYLLGVPRRRRADKTSRAAVRADGPRVERRKLHRRQPGLAFRLSAYSRPGRRPLNATARAIGGLSMLPRDGAVGAHRAAFDERTSSLAPAPRVSVVLPTFNRADMLAACLRALDAQRLSPADYEVVVVDDGSTDRTPAVIGQWTSRTGMARRAYSRANGGPAAARNDGIRRARGALIAFLDDDCIPDADWLPSLLDAFPADASCAGIGGRIVGASDALVARYVDWRGLLVHQRSGDGIVYLVTANALFQKRCLLEVGGFDERFRWAGGEDPELARRLRARGYYLLATERARVVHRHRETFRELMDMATRYGRGAAIEAQLYGQSRPAQRVRALVMAVHNLPGEAHRCFTRRAAATIDRVAYLGLGFAWQLAHARAYASCPPVDARVRAGGRPCHLQRRSDGGRDCRREPRTPLERGFRKSG